MTRYFVAANIWLIITLALLVGRTYERSEPLRYSFFHAAWFSPGQYTALVLAALFLAGMFGYCAWSTRRS